MKRFVAFIFFAVAVGAAYFLWVKAYSADAKAQMLVIAKLTDPESARFQDIYINAATGVVCGSVNAKNKMGGYTGFRQFLISKSGVVAFDPDDPTGNETASELIAGMSRKLEFLSAVKENCQQPKTQ